MCRLTAVICYEKPILLGDVLTNPSMSIITQSFNSRERETIQNPKNAYQQSSLNGDGFGVGWYAPKGTAQVDTTFPCVFTSLKPAWRDRNLHMLASKTLSPLLLAHVRAAGPSSGSPTELTCHPFVHQKFLFMHNGVLAGVELIRREVLGRLSAEAFEFAMQQTCMDSVLLFALFITFLPHGGEGEHSAEDLRVCLQETLQAVAKMLEKAGVEGISLLNIVVSDGKSLIASRQVIPSSADAASLYFATGTDWCRKSGSANFSMVHTDKRTEIAIVTSEPLTDVLEDWVPVPKNHILTITSTLDLSLYECLLAPSNSSTFSVPFQKASSTTMETHFKERLNVRRNSEAGVPSTVGEEKAHCIIEYGSPLLCGLDEGMRLVAGDGDGRLVYLDPKYMRVGDRMQGHVGSVLSLVYVNRCVVSGGSDNSIIFWNIEDDFNLKSQWQFKYHPLQGDVLSLEYLPCDEVLLIGYQSTALGVMDFSDSPKYSDITQFTTGNLPKMTPPTFLLIKSQHIGFIESIKALPKNPYNYTFITAAGDGFLRIWSIKPSIQCLHILEGHTASVMSLSCHSDMTVYSGSRDRTLRVWMLSSLSCSQVKTEHNSEVLSVVADDDFVLSGSATGELYLWERASMLLLRVLTCSNPPAFTDIFLKRSSEITVIAMGGSGRLISWLLPGSVLRKSVDEGRFRSGDDEWRIEPVLAKFISIMSVSGKGGCLSSQWKAANYISECLRHIGAELRLADAGMDRGPIVLARLGKSEKKKTLCFYGHYDVVSAMGTWESDPWVLSGRNGFFYGRGVTDNKGPVVASIFAASYLLSNLDESKALNISPRDIHNKLNHDALPCNLAWIIEGEEENSSLGFDEAIKLHADFFGKLDAICSANSYWVDDTRPCLVYGMRGVIDIKITVVGGNAPSGNHSGLHGGAIHEPMTDILALASSLLNPNTGLSKSLEEDCLVPTDKEKRFLKIAGSCIDQYRTSTHGASLKCSEGYQLMENRWFNPAVSITEVYSSSQKFNTLGETHRLIPSQASANISIRILPEQNSDGIYDKVVEHLEALHKKRGTGNSLHVELISSAAGWVADCESKIYDAAYKAIEFQWGQKPIYVKEGGTMPVLHFLQSFFNVPTIQIPLGRASDGAHLPNERFGLDSLYKGVRTLAKLVEIFALE